MKLEVYFKNLPWWFSFLYSLNQILSYRNLPFHTQNLPHYFKMLIVCIMTVISENVTIVYPRSPWITSAKMLVCFCSCLFGLLELCERTNVSAILGKYLSRILSNYGTERINFGGQQMLYSTYTRETDILLTSSRRANSITNQNRLFISKGY